MTTADLGRAITEARAALGLNIAQAAHKGGMSRTTWYRTEKGVLDPQAGTLVKIDKALGWDRGHANSVYRGWEPPRQPDQTVEIVLRVIVEIRQP